MAPLSATDHDRLLGGPNDAFFGVAVSPDGSRVAVVGYLGRADDDTEDDDGAVLWLGP